MDISMHGVWSLVRVCLWKCQAPPVVESSWARWSGLRASVPGYPTQSSNGTDQKKALGGARVYLHACVCECTERSQSSWHIFWGEKSAKPGCLTSLIDALPRNLSLHRVMWYIRVRGSEGSFIARQKEMRMDGETRGVQRGRWQEKKILIYNV